MTPGAPIAARAVSVGPVSLQGRGLGQRVTALVNGVSVWFESQDVELSPAPEAFGCAFLIPALHQHSRLKLGDPADPAWLASAAEMTTILHRWWKYPARGPEAPRVRGGLDDPVTAVASLEAGGTTALFFSGGVDSFHALLRGATRADWLVTLEGFDFPLEDRVRASAVEASVRQVASSLGRRAVIVRTNVREHPLVRATPWDRAHGGVLAGVAQLLAPAVRRALISGNTADAGDRPSGTHWQIDPLWSSHHTTIEHMGRGVRRIDKLRAIGTEPLVRDHLRVCWQNLEATGNCSRCAKCLLAMVVLEESGELARSKVFADREQLVKAIEAHRGTPDRYRSFEELANGSNLDPTVAAAVHAFVRRSRHSQRRHVRFRRALVAWLLARVGGPAS